MRRSMAIAAAVVVTGAAGTPLTKKAPRVGESFKAEDFDLAFVDEEIRRANKLEE